MIEKLPADSLNETIKYLMWNVAMKYKNFRELKSSSSDKEAIDYIDNLMWKYKTCGELLSVCGSLMEGE